jgi:hypothetical protein
MTFNECFDMLMNLASMKMGEDAYITLRYEKVKTKKEDNCRSRISCYSNAISNWTGEFQSYEDVIRDFSLLLSKKPQEKTP